MFPIAKLLNPISSISSTPMKCQDVGHCKTYRVQSLHSEGPTREEKEKIHEDFKTAYLNSFSVSTDLKFQFTPWIPPLRTNATTTINSSTTDNYREADRDALKQGKAVIAQETKRRGSSKRKERRRSKTIKPLKPITNILHQRRIETTTEIKIPALKRHVNCDRKTTALNHLH